MNFICSSTKCGHFRWIFWWPCSVDFWISPSMEIL